MINHSKILIRLNSDTGMHIIYFEEYNIRIVHCDGCCLTAYVESRVLTTGNKLIETLLHIFLQLRWESNLRCKGQHMKSS